MNRERSRTKEIAKRYESKNKESYNRKKAKQEIYADSKGKQKLNEIKNRQLEKKQNILEEKQKKIDNFPQKLIIQFTSAEGENLKGQLEVSSDITKEELNSLINKLKAQSNQDLNNHIIMVDDCEITKSLKDTLLKNLNLFTNKEISAEDEIQIVYHPENLFAVKPLTRGGYSLESHTDSILCCMFSPCGQYLASGGGDKILRIWDMQTFTLMHNIEYIDESKDNNNKLFNSWIMNVNWSPCGSLLVCGSLDGRIVVVDGKKGKATSQPLSRAHEKCVTALSWKPLHLLYHDEESSLKFISSGKDGYIKCFNALTLSIDFNIKAHEKSISKVIWSGEDVIYSCSQDMLVKSFSNKGVLLKNFKGHAHWINTMAINTEFVLRTGYYDHGNVKSFISIEDKINVLDKNDKDIIKEKSKLALDRYNSLKKKLNFKSLDRLVTGSDDFSMILWNPDNDLNSDFKSANSNINSKYIIARMTGHNQLINHVMFSPNTLFIASASFDKCIKLWNGLTGTFLHNFHGHVAFVYNISWSSDSKFVLSASKDSTVKLWNVKSDKNTKSCRHNLPGHADEVYCIDWSPDGVSAASGSKDQRVNIWSH